MLVALSAVLLALNRHVEDPFALYWLNLAVAALALSTVGALVASRQPENPVGWLLGTSGLLYAVMVSVGEYGTYALLTEGGSLPGGVMAAWLGSWLYVLGANLVLYSFLLFPDGRLPSPRWRVLAWLVALAICLDAVSLAPGELYGFPGVENPFGIEVLARLPGPIGAVTSVLVLAAILVPVIALITRFRRARGDERQQIKWVVYAVAVLVAAIVAVNLWPALDPSFAGAALFLAGFVAIPAAIGVAIFKYRLYDIDLVINRTLVYGTLTVIVVGIYVLVVGYLGALFRTGGDLAISLVATGVVAVLFAPLRDRLQQGVNRLMYGERDEPYAAVSRLGKRLEGTLAPEAVLPAIVETVRDALKLPYAGIALPRNGSFEIVTASGEEPSAEPFVLSLSYGGATVGRLLLAPRTPGEGFSSADRRLLDGLARHAGVAVHGVRTMNDLRRSRERLVLAREEERRRLRRDLHDELAPTLAALGLGVATVGELIPTDPKEAASANEKLRAAIRATVGDVRRLVYDLRPPALDELGLVEAIKERASRYSTQQEEGFQATVEAPDELPPLPAAVEVAAYRIVQEALTNVSRHAQASACTVRLACPDGRALTVEVTDDGVGLPGTPEGGVGLSSMHERAAELGGECEIVRSSPVGTRVFVRLPLVGPDGRPG